MPHRSNYLKSFLARSWAAPVWRRLYKASVYGMGYRNTDRELSGEDRFCRNLAGVLGAEAAPLVFDIGAHKGTFSRALDGARTGLGFEMFEPHPKTFSRLKANTATFRNDVTLHNGAVGNGTDPIQLFDYVGDGSPFASTLRGALDTHDEGDVARYEVPQFRVDDMRSGRRIGLLKMDVEGAEGAVMDGARASLEAGAVDVVFMEYSHLAARDGLSLQGVQRLLPGFDLFRIAPDRLIRITDHRESVSSWNEVPHYQNIVAVSRGNEALHGRVTKWSRRFPTV